MRAFGDIKLFWVTKSRLRHEELQKNSQQWVTAC